jgi:hypothetical protein
MHISEFDRKLLRKNTNPKTARENPIFTTFVVSKNQIKIFHKFPNIRLLKAKLSNAVTCNMFELNTILIRCLSSLPFRWKKYVSILFAKFLLSAHTHTQYNLWSIKIPKNCQKPIFETVNGFTISICKKIRFQSVNLCSLSLWTLI